MCFCHLDERPPRKEIDMAIGVLIGLRHCSERQAFADIAAAVHQTGIGLGVVSNALVALAAGGNTEWADSVALQHWRTVLGKESHVAM
jgi:hypothetical protein